MININKIMKENVSINMNLDVENRGLWEKGNQLGCDTITLTGIVKVIVSHPN